MASAHVISILPNSQKAPEYKRMIQRDKNGSSSFSSFNEWFTVQQGLTQVSLRGKKKKKRALVLSLHTEQNEKLSPVIYPPVTYGSWAQLITLLNTWFHIKPPLLLSNGLFKISVLTGSNSQGPARGATQVECWKNPQLTDGNMPGARTPSGLPFGSGWKPNELSYSLD